MNHAHKSERSSKTWTVEELNYLQDKWGSVSIASLSKKLKRSVNSIKIKSYRIGLRNMIEAGEYITFNQFMLAFKKTNASSYYSESWLKNRDFPVKYRTVISKRISVVYLNDFWKWAEKYRSFLDFSKFEENLLGVEPSWAKQQRRIDIETKLAYKKTPWTKAEDAELTYRLKRYEYSYAQLSKMLMRTCGAIQRRILDLGLKERPVKADNHTPWTEDEITTVLNCVKQGFSYELIAERVDRSAKAIRGKVYTMYKTENLDKLRQVI